MPGLTKRFLETRSGSRVALHEGGDGPREVLLIGGISPTPALPEGIRAVAEDLAARGIRVVVMELPGSGVASPAPDLTMDQWLSDLEQVMDEALRGKPLVTGASMGGWLMLLAHRRRPDGFRAMCALGPAIDWDQTFIGPGLRDGRLTVEAGGSVTNPERTFVAGRELLISMARHHLLRRAYPLAAPLHVIAGLRDDVAPAAAVRAFVAAAQGAPCTAEFLTEADHRLTKLDGPLVNQRYRDWLGAQLGEQLA